MKRKKAGKKKALKKKAVKKAAKKAKKTIGVGGNVVVVVLDPAIPLGDTSSFLNRDLGDRICWVNLDSVEHSIVFNPGEWPFKGKQKPIVVGSNRLKTRTVRSNADKTQYDYEVDPVVIYVDPDSPPDGPAVVVGGE